MNLPHPHFAGTSKESDKSEGFKRFLREIDILNDGANLRSFSYKINLQKYTLQCIDPTYILVFAVYLGMPEIFTYFPTGHKQMHEFYAIFLLFVHFLLGNL